MVERSVSSHRPLRVVALLADPDKAVRDAPPPRTSWRNSAPTDSVAGNSRPKRAPPEAALRTRTSHKVALCRSCQYRIQVEGRRNRAARFPQCEIKGCIRRFKRRFAKGSRGLENRASGLRDYSPRRVGGMAFAAARRCMHALMPCSSNLREQPRGIRRRSPHGAGSIRSRRSRKRRFECRRRKPAAQAETCLQP